MDKKPIQFIRREIEPIEIKIAGETYPAILSYRALALRRMTHLTLNYFAFSSITVRNGCDRFVRRLSGRS